MPDSNTGPSTLQKKPSRTARFVAVETLCRLYQQRTPVKPLLERGVRHYALHGNERNLSMQLIYGVLRNRQYLDRILQLLSKTPLAKIDPFVHQALAVGLYQLFFLERIPQSAAVNEMVECCKKGGVPKRLEGFVNGILRQSIRVKGQLAVQAATTDTGAPITNHPQWLLARWQAHFGHEEALRICHSNNHEPLLVLRINDTKITREEFCKVLDAAHIAASPGSYGEQAVILPEYQGSIQDIPGYAEGHFQVQDQSAQLATGLLRPLRLGGRYLDGCAGLGGKTSHLVEMAAGYQADIHAVEPEPSRLQKLQDNMQRLGAGHTPTIHALTLQQFTLEHLQPFDGILIDAPCSGTGVTGRHPDIRWNRREEDLIHYQQEQLHLLDLSAGRLVPGGTLVYATCSLEPEENQEVLKTFLATHPEMRLTDCSPQLPESAHRFVIDGCFTPHPTAGMDGFFAARLQRRESQ